jgi:hypothetical protein
MSMPVGQTCTHIVQSMQSPKASPTGFSRSSTWMAASTIEVVPRAPAARSAALLWRANQAAGALQHAGEAALLAWATRFTAALVVGDDEGVAIEHRTLESSVRAHVLADLLTQEAGVAPGGKAVEQRPEGFVAAPLEGHEARTQLADRREVADEGEACPQREHRPQQVFRAFTKQLLARPRRGVELHALGAVALGPALHPDEDFRPHGLRAGVAAPQAPGERGEEEQREPRHHQQQGEEDEILRPEHEAEHVELARR